MEYKKPSLTFEEQADLLLSRGLKADRDALISTLSSINYYRLSGYLFPFRNQDNTFREGTTLTKIMHYYDFDRKLRCLVFDGIEKVEIAIRTKIVYEFAHECGPFGHLTSINLSNVSRKIEKCGGHV